jgi:hypothetical protein
MYGSLVGSSVRPGACSCDRTRHTVKMPHVSLRCLSTCYLLLTTCYLLLATYYLLLATCYLPLATCYWLLATCYLLLATCYLLLATCYLLLATCCLLLTTNYLLQARELVQTKTQLVPLLRLPGATVKFCDDVQAISSP